MSYAFPPELDRMVRHRLATGEFASEDEVLAAMRALDDRSEAIAGIQEGMRDAEAGWTRPWAEVDLERRTKYGVWKDT